MRLTSAVQATLLMLVLALCNVDAQSITYQGELNQNGNPANGTFDFEFQLYDGGNIIVGSPVGSPVPVNDVAVTDGRFTVNLTFPIESLDNSNRWLRIRVNGTWLSPFQSITRSPYAIQTRGINVNAIQDVSIGTAGFPEFSFAKLFVDSAQALFAFNAQSSNSMFPTIFAINDSGGPVIWGRKR